MQAIKQCMQLIQRHKKANGLLEPTAWGCFFLLAEEVHQSLLSVIPLQAAGSVCASCHRNGPSAEAASDVAEVDILTDKLAPLYCHCHYILPSVFGDIDGRQQSMRQKH